MLYTHTHTRVRCTVSITKQENPAAAHATTTATGQSFCRRRHAADGRRDPLAPQVVVVVLLLLVVVVVVLLVLGRGLGVEHDPAVRHAAAGPSDRRGGLAQQGVRVLASAGRGAAGDVAGAAVARDRRAPSAAEAGAAATAAAGATAAVHVHGPVEASRTVSRRPTGEYRRAASGVLPENHPGPRSTRCNRAFIHDAVGCP